MRGCDPPGTEPASKAASVSQGRPSGWVRVAALVYIAALVVVTLLPIAWFGRLDDYRPQLVPFEGILSS